MEGVWDKLVLKDCTMEQVERGLWITEEYNVCTQINVRNVWARKVPVFVACKESKTVYQAEADTYLVTSFVHGLRKEFGADRTEAPDQKGYQAVWQVEKEKPEFSYEAEPEWLPEQSRWGNVREYGAVGDGKTDDTEAIRRAVEAEEIVYFPQGRYHISDTIILKEKTKLLGFHPMATELCLSDNEEAFAGVGAPKGLIEAPQGGSNYIRSIGIDTMGRNPRAAGIKWQAGEKSGLYDIKFTGGHGRISAGQEFLPSYNRTRTWDYNEEYDWDSQYWSLWITKGGGGSFKNIWTACPYAAAGIYISDTDTKGTMYQVSSEHHVRQEVVLRKVENWEFYALQTEEEVAEGSHCQPLELSDCRKLLFANLYAFRVIWVDNPYDAVIRIWNCEQIEIQNFHNFTQMKYTILHAVRDMNSGKTEGEWQMALFRIGETEQKKALPEQPWEPKCFVSGLDAVDSMCSDKRGTVYLCDSRLKRVYAWDQASGRMSLLLTLQYRPLTVAVDTEGNLLLVLEYRPVKYARWQGQDELAQKEFGERSEGDFGACFYPFFRRDRRIRAISLAPEAGEESIRLLDPVPLKENPLTRLYYPVNQWRDNGDMKSVIQIPDQNCYLAPDGVTGIVHTPALARAAMLACAEPGRPFYAVDEYNKYVLRLTVGEDRSLHNPEVAAYHGEYSALASKKGMLFVTDNVLYCYEAAAEGQPARGEEAGRLAFADRPAGLCWLEEQEEWLLISARTRFYVMKVG